MCVPRMETAISMYYLRFNKNWKNDTSGLLPDDLYLLLLHYFNN